MIILHTSTINEDRVMYGAWNKEHNGKNFFSFWTIFLLFYPPLVPEILCATDGRKSNI